MHGWGSETSHATKIIKGWEGRHSGWLYSMIHQPVRVKEPMVQRLCQGYTKMVWIREPAVAPWGATASHDFHKDSGSEITANQLEKCEEVSGGASQWGGGIHTACNVIGMSMDRHFFHMQHMVFTLNYCQPIVKLHWVDEKCNMQTTVLDTIAFNVQHTKCNISKAIWKWGLNFAYSHAWSPLMNYNNSQQLIAKILRIWV